MQQQEKVAKLVQWFARGALRHAEALEAMQEEAALGLVENLDRFYASMKREDGLEIFLTLLDHEDSAVAGMAAVYAMREAPDRCAAVLGKIAQSPDLLGFRAQAALDRWKSGDWPR